MLPEDAAEQPTLAHVIRVNDAAAAELDALARVVDPGEVDVEGGLDEPKDDLDGFRGHIADVELADDPVQNIQAAVETQGEEVVRVDNGRNGGLAEEEELREDAHGFEDVRVVPEPLEKIEGGKSQSRLSWSGWLENRRVEASKLT